MCGPLILAARHARKALRMNRSSTTTGARRRICFVALIGAALLLAALAAPASAWAYFTDSDSVENRFHVEKRPLLIDVDVQIPEDYVLTTEAIDPSIFTPTAVFKHDYEEPLTPSDVTFAPTAIPEGTKGPVKVTVTYTRGDVTVSKDVTIQADVPVATIPASSIGVGSKVKFGKNSSITWTVIGKNHAGNPSNSLTLMAPSYGKKPMGPSGKQWSDCTMRSWLNSASGFLSGWTDAEKAALLATTTPNHVGTALSTNTTDKVYLLTRKEFNIGNGPTDNATTAYDVFRYREGAVGTGKTEKLLGNNEDHWTRTGVSGTSYYIIPSEYYLYKWTYSTVTQSNKYYDPVVNISQNQLVRAKRDASGCYVIYFP